MYGASRIGALERRCDRIGKEIDLYSFPVMGFWFDSGNVWVLWHLDGWEKLTVEQLNEIETKAEKIGRELNIFRIEGKDYEEGFISTRFIDIGDSDTDRPGGIEGREPRGAARKKVV